MALLQVWSGHGRNLLGQAFVHVVGIHGKCTHCVSGTILDTGDTEWGKPGQIPPSSILGSIVTVNKYTNKSARQFWTMINSTKEGKRVWWRIMAVILWRWVQEGPHRGADMPSEMRRVRKTQPWGNIPDRGDIFKCRAFLLLLFFNAETFFQRTSWCVLGIVRKTSLAKAWWLRWQLSHTNT